MALYVFDNMEHQALFMGDLNPNMIKYVWVKENGEQQYQKYTEKIFKKYNKATTVSKGDVQQKDFNGHRINCFHRMITFHHGMMS